MPDKARALQGRSHAPLCFLVAVLIVGFLAMQFKSMTLSFTVTQYGQRIPTDREIKLTSQLLDQHKRHHDNAIFVGMGYALSGWAQLEEGLVSLVASLLLTDPNKAGLVMYNVISFATWLHIIDGLFSIDEKLNPLKPKWEKINKRLMGLKDTRDRLAHHSVFAGQQEFKVDSTSALAPARFDLRTKSLKMTPMNADEVYEYLNKLGKMINDVRSLVADATEIIRSLQEKSGEPERDQNPPSNNQ